MDFNLRKQTLLKRAEHVEERANRMRDAQALDILRALALLYREMANVLEDGGLFEHRFDAVVCADLARAIDQ